MLAIHGCVRVTSSGWDSKLVSSFTAPANGPSRGRTRCRWLRIDLPRPPSPLPSASCCAGHRARSSPSSPHPFPITHPLFCLFPPLLLLLRPKRKFDDLGNLAWGGGSCQGIISSHSFALETGLKKITAMLTKQIDAKVMRKRSLRMASLAEEDAAGVSGCMHAWARGYGCGVGGMCNVYNIIFILHLTLFCFARFHYRRYCSARSRGPHCSARYVVLMRVLSALLCPLGAPG